MKRVLALTTIVVLSMFSAVTPRALIRADSTEISIMSRNELSWVTGDSFPFVDGHVIPPPLAQSASTDYNETHWYAGSVYPSSSVNQSARTIGVSIAIPASAPGHEEFYYVVLSAFDSNGSYNQIGFCADYGHWGLAYSWTSGYPYPAGAPTVEYHFNESAITLSTAVTYTFCVTTQGGVTHFAAYEGSAQVWFLDAPTGGDYLILSDYYSGGKRGRAPYDYTNYEEIWYTSTSGGSPAFNFNFYDNYWISTDGIRNAPTWTQWFAWDEPFNVPSSVNVEISGNSVLVENLAVAGAPSLTVYWPPVNGATVSINGVVYPGTQGVTITRIHWAWGDRKEDDQWFPGSHTYTASGDYTVVVTAYQSDGRCSSKPMQIYGVVIGDLNGDLKVGLSDLVILAKAYGSKPGDPNWKPIADIDSNLVVGLSDLVALAQHYGQHYP